MFTQSQVHSLAALLFMLIGPFQFNPSFRNKNPVFHKRLGYVFVMATIVTAVTGATRMANVSELGPIAVLLSRFMGPLTLIDLAISVNAARKKDFQKHRRYMLRSAAIGYVTILMCRSNFGMNCARLLDLIVFYSSCVHSYCQTTESNMIVDLGILGS